MCVKFKGMAAAWKDVGYNQCVKILDEMYERLHAHYGPQGWWPGRTPFEVAVGAVLTQNTNWQNVERAIKSLRAHKALSARAIHAMPVQRLSSIIRPAGYFNVKAKRLRAFVDFLVSEYAGSMKRMAGDSLPHLRPRLLAVHGVGPETADSILLYGLHKPVFVIDAYTKRVLSRHGLMEYHAPYDDFQGLFHGRYLHSKKRGVVSLFNEFHALFVAVGKERCRPRRPLCGGCPLGEM